MQARESQKNNMNIRNFFTAKNPLILASKSPQRAEILDRLNIVFEACPSDEEEIFNSNDPLEKIAQDLALLKAKSVLKRYPNSIVLGVDTFVVSSKGKIITKPKNREEAKKILMEKSNSTEKVLSGIVLVSKDKQLVKTEVSKVFFADINPEDAEIILSFNEWQGRSGGFSIEGKTSFYVKGIEGDFWNIVGLPVYCLRQVLNEFLN